MKRAAAFVGLVSVPLANLYGLRTGYFGTKKIVVHDDKTYEHGVALHRTLLQDKLCIYKSHRTDWWIFEWFYQDCSDVTSYRCWSEESEILSYKPIEFELVPYEKSHELITALEKKFHQSYDADPKEESVRADLKKVIANF
jgi:hypothetical protein